MLTIPDELLEQAGLSEEEARVEIACQMYAAGKLTLALAGRLATLEGAAIEAELGKRGIPLRREEPGDSEACLAAAARSRRVSAVEKMRGRANMGLTTDEILAMTRGDD